MNRKRAASVIAAALTLLLCAALCAAVLSLYFEGAARRAQAGSSLVPVFTREGVGRRLLWVLPAAVLWLGAMIAAAAAGRSERGQSPAVRPRPGASLPMLRARLDALPEGAAREETFRGRVLTAAALTAVCVFAAASPLLDGSRFVSRDPEAVTGALLRGVLPPAAAALTVLLCAAWVLDVSLAREEDILRAEIRRLRPPAVRPSPARVSGGTGLSLVRGLLLGLAAALILEGVRNGGLRDMLIKATNICTECIGLG